MQELYNRSLEFIRLEKLKVYTSEQNLSSELLEAAILLPASKNYGYFGYFTPVESCCICDWHVPVSTLPVSLIHAAI